MKTKLPKYFSEKKSEAAVVNFETERPVYEPDNGATSWYAQIGMGTPSQGKLRFMIDTGTKNTWITSTLCTTNACAPHNKFNPETSSTYKNDGEPKTVSFGDWGSMTITPSKDVINLPGIAGPLAIEFDMSTSYTGSQFQELICDGGIAIPCHLPEGPNSTDILNTLKQKGLIKFNVASFWYDRQTRKGQIQFGGIDLDKFNPKTLNILPLINFPSDMDCWLVNLESISGVFPDGSNQNMLKNVAFALDSGSSKFKGDPKFINACKKVITHNGKYPETINSPNKVSDYPYPVLELVLNGVTYQLPPEKYFLHVSETERKLAFHYLAGCENEFLVGSTLLETLYTVYDFDNRWIILAEPVF